MRIHKSDPKAIASTGCKTWQEIMEVVKERAFEREGVLHERRVMGRCMDAFVEV